MYLLHFDWLIKATESDEWQKKKKKKPAAEDQGAETYEYNLLKIKNNELCCLENIWKSVNVKWKYYVDIDKDKIESVISLSDTTVSFYIT